MSKQPEINIGMVGHVDHGKTTLIQRLAGKWADTHSEEQKKGITIRLGYANTVFYKCDKCGYSTEKKCSCKTKPTEVLRVSFVDAPGHETLMATMLSGSAIMDAALLMVAADEKCPQPQTKEHLMALEIGGIKNIVIVQNKIDLVSTEAAIKNYNQIKEFTKGTVAENAPVVPISAQHNINIDILIQTIVETFKVPERDVDADPIMFVARSFDINKPGASYEKVVGGVLGGALRAGKLNEGDKIEIRPGRKVEKENKIIYEPIYTEIVSIRSEKDELKEAIPGGSIALLTKLDPSIVKSDSLSGNVVGHPEKLPPIYYDLELEPHLLNRVVGVEKETDVEPIKKGETLMLNVNATTTVGIVTELSKKGFKAKLKLPIFARKEDKIIISRLLGHRFRLIGYATIQN